MLCVCIGAVVRAAIFTWYIIISERLNDFLFVVLVSKCVVFGMCQNISVHHLSISGARMLYRISSPDYTVP